LTFQNTSSALKIVDVTINPLNRAIIEFDNLPDNLNSQLSDDKTKVIITIPKAEFPDKFRQISGLGVISDVFINNNIDNTTNINIKTTDKRGYTIFKNPFSNKLVIEVFLWDKISKEEEFFRTGLLALEDNIFDESIKNLHSASKMNFSQANYFLGILYLKTGYFQQAESALKFAIQNDSSNIDALIGLSQVYSKVGNTDSAEYYLKLIREKNTNYSSTLLLVTNIIIDSIYLDLSHLNFTVKDTINNTVPDSTLTNKNNKDSILQQTENDSKNDLFADFSSFIEYTLIILGGTILAIVFYYFKWRKQKLNQIKNTKPISFNEEMAAAKTAVNAKAVTKIYQSNDENKPVDESVGEDNKPNNVINVINQEKIDKLGSLIQSITGKPAESYKTQAKDSGNMNAKLQLSIHLAEEQRKIKSQNIENLKNTTIPTDKKKLSEISKKLGIEKGVLETKAAMEKILKDKDKMKKLNDKFGGN
jgi:tetratricopeptide (TPR) repeat protein